MGPNLISCFATTSFLLLRDIKQMHWKISGCLPVLKFIKDLLN